MNLEGNLTSKQALKGVLAIRQGIDGKDGKDGQNGQNGKDGYTPQKGIDYFDGEKGEQGEVSIAYADSHYSPSIINSASGEVIAITDSANVKPNIKLFGKGKQRQYEGNQLLDADNIVKKDAISEKGVITITSDSADVYIAGSYNGTDTLFQLPQGNYMIGCSDSNVKISMYHSQGDLSDNIDTSKSLCTLSVDCSFIGIRVRSNDGTSLLGKSFTIMLNEGNTLKPWEPFVGNEPSPNMNYPQKAEFLGESGSIENKLLTANFYDSSYRNSSNSMYGMNCSPTEASGVFKVTASGTDICVWGQADKGQNYNAYVHGYLGVIPNNATEISVTLTNEKFVKSIVSFYDTNKIAMDWHGSGNKNKFTIQIPEGAKYFSLRFGNGNAVVGETYETSVMVNFGQPMDYEPYTEQPFTFQTPNGLRGVPLGKTIPDAIKNSPIHMSGVYWDGEQYQIADTENEDGKDVQRIIEYGVEDFTISRISRDSNWYDSEKSYSYEFEGLKLIDGQHGGFCTHATRYDFGNFYSKGIENGCFMGAGNLIFNISKSLGICATLDEFKQYCTDNNVRFYQILAEPIVTDTTEQYDVVMNYPNTTIVNDAGAYMEVEYVADTKCYIDNKFKELETNVTSAIAQLL